MWFLHGVWRSGHHSAQRFKCVHLHTHAKYSAGKYVFLNVLVTWYGVPDFSASPINTFYFSFFFLVLCVSMYFFFCHVSCKDSVSLDRPVTCFFTRMKQISGFTSDVKLHRNQCWHEISS